MKNIFMEGWIEDWDTELTEATNRPRLVFSKDNYTVLINDLANEYGRNYFKEVTREISDFDYKTDVEALTSIFEYYREDIEDASLDDIVSMIDPNYRAKDIDFDDTGKRWTYEIEGYGDDLDIVAKIFGLFYINEAGKYTLTVIQRQTGDKVTYSIIIK